MSRLRRWSQRKRHAGEDAAPAPAERTAPETDQTDEALSPTAEVAGASEMPSVEARSDQTNAEAHTPAAPGSLDETLPDPETLPPGSDFSVFMASGVSSALRRRALKRLWATGRYNVRDGLDDYDADYRQTLKPMASEMADKLRSWTHKAEETLEDMGEQAQNEAVDAPADDPEHPSQTPRTATPIANASENADNGRHRPQARESSDPDPERGTSS